MNIVEYVHPSPLGHHIQHPASGSVHMRIYFKKKTIYHQLAYFEPLLPKAHRPADRYVRLGRAAG